VIEAIRAAAGDGTSYGAPTEREVLLAEEIRRRVPSCDKVRMVSSGTEATMTALRLARGATGRTKVVKFAGNYHGHGDALLAESGSAVAHLDPAHSPGGVPGSAGVPAAAVTDTVIAPYNDVPELDRSVACVIVEPVAANMGLVQPVDGFLAGLRAECDRVGAILIFDEVITGFRLGYGGAQEAFGVTPDLTTFGKVIGGGLNVGAFGGRAEIMDHLAPLGSVYQAGTLSGNPLATAAGLAALDLLDHDAHAFITAQAERLAEGLRLAFDDAGLAAVVSTAGPLVGLFFGETAPRTYAEARTTDESTYAAFFHAMLRRGVALAPGAYEVMFPGMAHDDATIDRITELAAEAATEVASTR
jgi:glutamate-1-semialdehyde 2,1-aminomutase